MYTLTKAINDLMRIYHKNSVTKNFNGGLLRKTTVIIKENSKVKKIFKKGEVKTSLSVTTKRYQLICSR